MNSPFVYEVTAPVSVSQDHMQRPLYSETGPRYQVLDVAGEVVRSLPYGYRTGPMPDTVLREAQNHAEKIHGSFRHVGSFA